MDEPFRAEHAERTASFVVPLAADRAFALFTPEGEKSWADGGRCAVSVGYAFTGLAESGNEWIRDMDERRYAEFIGAWRSEIEAMLARGAAQ